MFFRQVVVVKWHCVLEGRLKRVDVFKVAHRVQMYIVGGWHIPA